MSVSALAGGCEEKVVAISKQLSLANSEWNTQEVNRLQMVLKEVTAHCTDKSAAAHDDRKV